jgi:hypothetical protein
MSINIQSSNNLNRGFVAISLLFVSIVTSQIAIAGDEDLLIGTWEDGTEHHLYGTVIIGQNKISWGKEKNDPGCEGSYEVVAKDYADTFPGQLSAFRHLVKERMYHIVKIKLIENTCDSDPEYLQFAFPTDVPGYVDVVDYYHDTEATGWTHFHKRK